MRGSVFSASAPQAPGSIGTTRQPASSSPCRCSCAASAVRAAAASCGLLGEKHQPGGEACAERDPGLGGQRAQEPFRALQQQPAAITGLAVRGDRPAMGQAVERGHGGAHQPVARTVVQTCDQPEAAAVALVGVLIESRVRRAWRWPRCNLERGSACAPGQSLPQAQGLTAIQALKEIRRTVRSANEQPRPDGGGALPIDRLSYTITMRSIIPARDELARVDLMTELHTERLLLRHWRAADGAPFAALNADPVVMQFMAGCLTRSESDAWVRQAREALSRHGFGPWALELKAAGRFIGCVGLALCTFEAPFTPCVEILLAPAALELGTRLRHRGGACLPAPGLRGARAARDRRVHGARERALARAHAAPRDAARSERGLRASAPARGTPAAPPRVVSPELQGVGGHASLRFSARGAWPETAE